MTAVGCTRGEWGENTLNLLRKLKKAGKKKGITHISYIQLGLMV